MVTKESAGTTLADAGGTGNRRAVAISNGAHVLHDGLSDLLYILFPIWQVALGLDYASIGALKACYSGAMASFQLTATWLAARLGHGAILAGGTALAGLGFFFAAQGGTFIALATALFVAGAGAAAQHPLGSEIVSRMTSGAKRRQALGVYNAAGDVGKVAFPALSTAVLLYLPLGVVLGGIGMLAIAAGLVIFMALPVIAPMSGLAAPEQELGARSSLFRQRGFAILFGVGIIDSAGRAGFLTFFPLALAAKGATIGTIGLALTLVFVGGAVGKFICGPLGARFGVFWTVTVTEGATAMGALAAPFAPLWLALALAPLIGIALNGTSTVLYGTVPELVPEAARTRAFGLFYTGTVGAGAATPISLGFVGDALSLPTAMTVLAAVVLAAPMLTFALRAPLERLSER